MLGVKGRLHYVELDLDERFWEEEAEMDVVAELEYLTYCYGGFYNYLHGLHPDEEVWSLAE